MFSGDFDKLKRLARSVEQLADPNGRPQRTIARKVITELRTGPLREQYRTGIGPEGAWQPRKADGRPALVSRKLPTLVRGRPVRGGAVFEWRSAIMKAHHEGHVFPARRGGGQSLFYDERGRLIRLGRLSARAFRYKFVAERITRAHGIGARVLPPRPQYPRGPMPDSWRRPIERGLRAGMDDWGSTATR